MTEPVYNNSSLSFTFELVGTIPLDKNYQEVINSSFALPGFHSGILKTEKMLQFGTKKKRKKKKMARRFSCKRLTLQEPVQIAKFRSRPTMHQFDTRLTE